MRRILPVLVASVLVAFPSFAQRGGGARGGGGGGFHGGGSIGGRGGFSAGGFHGGGGGFHGGGFHNGGFRGGFRGNFGGFRGHYGYWGGIYPAWGWSWWNPSLWDTGWGWDYSDYGYPDYGAYPYYPANGGYGAASYSSPSPQVLIISNQTPPQPTFFEQPPPPAAWNAGPSAPGGGTQAVAPVLAKKYEEPLYLLAMKDGTIRAVLAYWVDGATVHYVTMDHEQKQAPLPSLDRVLSERLNRERNVTFSLPG